MTQPGYGAAAAGPTAPGSNQCALRGARPLQERVSVHQQQQHPQQQQQPQAQQPPQQQQQGQGQSQQQPEQQQPFKQQEAPKLHQGQQVEQQGQQREEAQDEQSPCPQTPQAVLARVHTPGKSAAHIAAHTSTPLLAHSAAAVLNVSEAWRQESHSQHAR